MSFSIVMMLVASLAVMMVVIVSVRRMAERRAWDIALTAEQDRLRALERDEHRRQVVAAFSVLQSAVADLRGAEYLARSEIPVWTEAHREAIAAARLQRHGELLPFAQREAFVRWCGYFNDLPAAIATHNKNYIDRQMQDEAAFFDRIAGNPLTRRQREAILTDEETTLVVAGAGTGKTSVIAAKVGWLLHHGLAMPEEILVLSFNRDAAKEAQHRVGLIPNADRVTVSTMHRFGLSLLARASGAKPSVSPLAEGDEALNRLIRDQLKAMLVHPEKRRLLVNQFSRDLDPAPEPEYQSPRHLRDIRGIMAVLKGTSDGTPVDEQVAAEWVWLSQQWKRGLLDLTGTKMQSRQEVKIANWLTLNGIAWEYERPYTYRTATLEHRQYKPDFYLTDHDIWIEHYGVGRKGETARKVDRDKYREGMQWKRTTHLTHGTICIETYSYQDADGTLFDELARNLEEAGVTTRPLTPEEVSELVDARNSGFAPLVKLLATALRLYRGSGLTRDEVRSRARSSRDHQFLAVLFDVVERYEVILRGTREIDFDDMIIRAREHLRSGPAQSGYRYILVDEFQDTSANRLGLLEDVRRRVPHARLFVVGDDWQAIYRFAGSDVSLMTELDRQPGTARVDLDTTFRYGQSLLDLSATFVQQNSAQLRKQLRAHSTDDIVQPVCVISSEWVPKTPKPTMQALRWALNDIYRRSGSGPDRAITTVQTLGRYNATEPDGFRELQDKARRQRIDLRDFSTIHKAKGTEADFVVLLDVTDGTLGLPSGIEDDPVLRMLMAEVDPFPDAEERRLFYVALTRARRRVYITTISGQHSRFIDEDLLSEALLPYVERQGMLANRHRCPACGELSIVRREGEYGIWWPCSRHPLCNGRLPRCPSCAAGGLERVPSAKGRGMVLVCTECQAVRPG